MFVALALGLVVAGHIVGAGVAGAASGIGWIAERPQRRRARIEAELDRKEAEMRQTVLRLANDISSAGLDARRRMIQESYLASGEVVQRD